MKTLSIFSLFCLNFNLIISLTFAQSVKRIDNYRVNQGDWKQYTVLVNNCDNDSPIYYNLEERVNLRQTLTLTSGWSIKPGLVVHVPKIGDISLGAELAKKFNASLNLENQTTQRLRVKINKETNMEYIVSIRETVASGRVTVTDDSWIFSNSETSNFTFVTARKIRITPNNITCLYGEYDFVAWDEARGRQGIGYILYFPQRRHIKSGTLTVDRVGNVRWSLVIYPPNIPPITLECSGLLDMGSKRIKWNHTTFNYGHVSGQVQHPHSEEFSYAFCGCGINPREGRLNYSDFRVDMPVDRRDIILYMSNSQGTFRWRKRAN